MTASSRRIILIGAARSGTKIARDVLATATGIGAVPYDVPFVWRTGHRRYPDDRLDPATLSPRQRAFIIGYVDRYLAGEPPGVIEKTVGNSVRVPFVHSVFPDATYIELVRDGVDVAESARRQWQAPVGARYLMKKTRHVPLRMLPTYGLSYTRSRLKRHTRSDGRVETWGVRYPGIDNDVRNEDLLTVCARQWRASVTFARDDFRRLSVPVTTLRYEDLVAAPEECIGALLEKLALKTTPARLAAAAGRVSQGRVGEGERSLAPLEMADLEREIGSVLVELGYVSPAARQGTA